MKHLQVIPILAVLHDYLFTFSLLILDLFLNYYFFYLFAVEVEMQVLHRLTSFKAAGLYITVAVDLAQRSALYILIHFLDACLLHEGNCTLHYIVQVLELDQIHFKIVYLNSDIDLDVFFHQRDHYFLLDAYYLDFLALMVYKHITNMYFDFE